MSPRPEPAAGALDTLVGLVSYGAWCLLGLLAWPLALAHPAARRHVRDLVVGEPGMTWLHGASRGEHRAALALLPALPEGALRTSSSWRTPVPGAFPAPLDLPGLTGRWLDAFRPGRLVLVEAELWPGWLLACRRRGIPVAVVNARDSRGTARWRALGPLWRWLVQGVVFLSQEELGDLKLAAPLPPAPDLPPLPEPLVLAASTRPGDEARLLAAWRGWAEAPGLVLAPRHASRFDEVADLLEASGLSWARRSAWEGTPVQVLLLDTQGELAGLHRRAGAALVGGSFDEALGGHSPAEALAAGIPVLGGPARHANPAAWRAATEAGLVVDLAAEPDPAELRAAVLEALGRGGRAVGAPSRLAEGVARALPTPVLPPERPARPWLWPAGPLVQGLGRLRPAWREAPVRVEVPVVSVGALTAGGSGKTPVVGWLAPRLPGCWVLARGYRRDPEGPELRVGLPDEDPEHDLGDELELLRRRGLPVISCPDRVAGAREAVRRGARVILLDDGFQHRRLHRDLDIVCVDARWPLGRGPIPVGTGREGPRALARAHVCWLTHAAPGEPLPDALAAHAGHLLLVRSRLRPTGWRQGGHHRPLPARRGPVDAVAGIAHPARFLATLLRAGLEVRSFRALPDHGGHAHRDPARLGELAPDAVITEKDAARLPPDHPQWALCVGLVVDEAAAVRAALADLGLEVLP